MKKLILFCAVLLSVFAAEAQTKKSKSTSKNSYATREKKADAAFKKKQAEKQQVREQEMVERVEAEKERLETERIADSVFMAQREEWKTNRLYEIDSINQEKWKSHAMMQNDISKLDKENADIATAAKLDKNTGRQVHIINSSYTQLAKEVMENMEMTSNQKHEQLIQLNNERISKIHAVVGKSKAKKFEKERKNYVKHHEDAVNELVWTDNL